MSDSDVSPRSRSGRVSPMTVCGYCAFGGNHHQCPGGVRNGNGSIHQCSCRATERCGQLRCTECNNRTPGEVGSDWHCLNKTDCEIEQEKTAQNNPTVMRIRAIREAHGMDAPVAPGTEPGTPGPTKTARSSRPPRKAGGPCLCGCEETTGGGKFKPGHDSKYLNKLVEKAARGGRHTSEAQDLAAEVSPAFLGKLRKRAGL